MMDINKLLIFLSLLVVVSYLFEIISARLRLPTVLFMLGGGIALRYFSDAYSLTEIPVQKFLPFVGTLGLILIVLDGALELKLSNDDWPRLRRILLTSSAITLSSILLFTIGFMNFFQVDFTKAFINSIPFSIISSAIAIPAANRFRLKVRDFTVYDSTLADIIGILLINAALIPDFPNIFTGVHIVWETIKIITVSIILCFFLLYLMEYITTRIKFFMIISILTLAYGIAKELHLSALVLILFFGLFINNAELFIPKQLEGVFKIERLDKQLELLKSLLAETSFVLRTLFFVMFGYSIHIENMMDLEVWKMASIIMIIVYSLRFGFIYFLNKEVLFPTVFIAPRGLINILLFLGIAPIHKIYGLNDNVLLAVIGISASSLLLTNYGEKKLNNSIQT